MDLSSEQEALRVELMALSAVMEPDLSAEPYEPDDRRLGKYWVRGHPWELDFSKEIWMPGIHGNYSDGVLCMCVDNDEWCVASIPLKFSDLPCEAIVKVLWPHLHSEAYFAEDMIIDPDSEFARAARVLRVLKK